MFETLAPIELQAEDTLLFQQSAWANARVKKRLDVELAAQLRVFLREDFELAISWSELRRALRAKGFSLKIDQGRLRVIDSISRVDICSTGFLGFPLVQLERQIGAPVEANLWNSWLIG